MKYIFGVPLSDPDKTKEHKNEDKIVKIDKMVSKIEPI